MKNRPKKISKIDESNTDPAYWDKVLRDAQGPPSVDEDAMDNATFGYEEPEDHGRKVEPVKSSDHQKLRGEIDGDDPFMDRPSIVSPANKDASKKIPDWVFSDELTRKVILQAFPKMADNPIQRKKAARWAAIISLYYRNGWSIPYVCDALHIQPNNLRFLLDWIKKSAAKTLSGATTKRGRPKKDQHH